jgi:hypothetical protein
LFHKRREGHFAGNAAAACLKHADRRIGWSAMTMDFTAAP